MGSYWFVYGYRGLYNNNYVELTVDKVEDIYKEGGTILYSSNKDNLFDYLVDDGNGGNNNQGNNNQGNNNKGDNVNKPGTPNNTNVAGKNNTTNKGTVKTGDTAPFMAMIVTILAAAGVIFGTVAQKTRRRRNRK